MFGSPSCPPSIEDMDYQWCACRRREKGTAWPEMKTAPDHNEKEQKQTNDQRAVFDVREHDVREHDAPPMRPGLAIASAAPSLT